MATTPNLLLPYLEAAQAQKHVTVNESLRRLDASVQVGVLDRDLAAPPPAPEDGDRFIVAAPGSGAWAGHDSAIAAWQDGAWEFYAPQTGWLAWIADEQALAVWDGAAWVVIVSADQSGILSADMIGINATADDTNRLALASAASLFNHAGAGHQVKINKAAAGDTASILFQTGFSGRAEMGTTGDDDFHFKVSPDGAAWHEAIVIDKDTGEVTLPARSATRRELLTADRTYYVRTAPATVTVSIASPAVVSWTGHGLQAGDPVVFSLPFDRKSGTVTIASPGVFTAAGHGYANGDPVKLSTTGALPSGLAGNTTYYVVNATADTFELAASPGGASINTSGSQSGTHYVERASSLPTGVTAGTVYYVLASGLTADSFQFSASPGGVAVNTSGSQAGRITAATGNDANDGLTQTRTGAFLTIQGAIDYLRQNVDFGRRSVVIQLAESTYSEPVGIFGFWQGGGEATNLSFSGSGNDERFIIRGNTANPSNVYVSVASRAAIKVGVFSKVLLEGLRISASTAGAVCIACMHRAVVLFRNMVFGACTGPQLEAAYGGSIVGVGAYDIVGGGFCHAQAYYHGLIFIGNINPITVAGPFGFTLFFTCVNQGFMYMGGNTYVGGSTITTTIRWDIQRGALVGLNNADPDTYLPGSGSGRSLGGLLEAFITPRLRNHTVANAPSASTQGAGTVIYVSNGDAGSPCLAVSDGTNWRRIALGAAISAS